MAYAVKYLFRFESANGTTREIHVLKDSYSGAVIQRALGRAPVLKKQHNGNVYGTSLEFYAECHVDREFIEFYTSDPKAYMVQLYDGSTLLWSGFVTPELYSEPDIAPPYDVQVVATDGVGELKLYDFAPQGLKTLRQMFTYLLGYTGVGTDVFLVSSLKPGSRGAGALLDMTINLDYMSGKTCYDVLTYLLDTLHATITWWKGAWILTRETNVTFTNGKVRYFNVSGNSALLNDSVQVLGRMYHSQAWPVGQLSTVIDPAKNKVTVQAPWRPVTCLQNADMTSDTGWTKANNASFGPDGYLFPNNDTGGNNYATAHIAQTLSMGGLRVPMSFELRATGVASEVGVRVGAAIGVLITYTVGNVVYHLRKGDEGTPVWKEGSAVGASIDGSLVDYQQPLASFDMDRIQAETLSIGEIPAFVQGTSYPAGTLAVYIVGTCARAFGAYLDVVLPKGYQDILRLDNGARGEGGEVEVAIGRETSDMAYYAAFLQGLLLDDGALITSFSDANFTTGMDYLAFIVRDYALSIALPRARVTGTVFLESAVQVPPLVFTKGALDYWVETWGWNLYEDELEISAVTLPAASLTVQSETLLESNGSTASSAGSASSSAGGSSIGGGGGANYFELHPELPLIRPKDAYSYLSAKDGLFFTGGNTSAPLPDLYVDTVPDGNGNYVRVLRSPLHLITAGDQIVGDGTPGGGGGGGGAQNLYQLSDVYGSVSVLRADGSAKQPGDVLAYNGSLDKWAATPMVQSVAGLTGAVTAAQIATALTNAGYKLTDTIYTLPAATTSALGGIQLGYTQSGKNYPVQLSSNKAYVNVPWTDTTYSSATTSAAGLMSAADKVKLNGIATGATNVTASTVSGWGFLTASAAAAAYQAKGSYVTYDKTTPPTDVNTPDSGTPSIRIIHSGLGPTDNFTPGPYGLLADFAVAAGHLQFGTNTTQNEVYVRSYWWATRSSGSTPFPGYPAWVKLYHSANLTKSVLTGLLEGNNGYYVKRAGDVMSGPLSGVTYLSVNNAAQTTYRFYVNGAAAVTGQLDLGNSSVSNINFKRGSASYITAPTDGYFTFVPNGLATNNGNSPLIVTAGSIYPGTDTDLGRSSSYWHYAYVNRVYLASGAYLEYNSTNGYIYISKPIVTEGDQIVASGTPGGGGGGGASFLYDLMDTLAGWTANTGVTTGQVLMYQAGANSKRGSGTGAWKYGTLAISNISGLQAALDAKQASGNYVTSVKVGSTSYAPSSGAVSLPAYPTTLPASDVYAWAKAAAKPSYTLDEVADGSTRKLSNYLYGTSNKSIIARATDNSNTWGALGFDDGDNAAFNFKVIRFGASPGASFGGSLSAYGSGLFFGGADTRAFMAVRYASGHVEFGGGSVSSPNNTPAWHFGISGTNGATYDLPTIATNASNGNTAYNSLGNYVLKAGDTMTGPLTVTGAANILLAADSAHATASYIRLRYNTGGTAVTGYIGLSSGKLVYHSDGDKEIWHAGNFVAGTHYVSISGTETITGAKTFTGGLYLKFANPRVVFQAADGTVHGNVAMRSAGVLEFYDLSSYRIVYHAGNANLSTVDWQAANLTAYALGLRRSSDGTVVFRITNPASTTEWRTAASGGGGFFTWYTNVNSTTAERMRLDNSGNLGIGTNAPTQKLHVVGTILSTGDQVISSDAALKTNFSRINYSVSDIAACRAVTFDWKDGRGRSAGSIAQDWKPLIPELVHGEDGNMTLAYGQIALVNTIIEAREIDVLKKRVAELEAEVKRLRS
jgi:hypothetical protein